MKDSKSFKVSIVITTRNGGDQLERCLDSIFRLNHPNKCEVIIVGDSSSSLVEVGKRYGAKILGANFLPGAKRNLATSVASGDLVAFCDDDSFVHKDWLKNLLSCFLDSKVAIVGGPNLTPPNSTLRKRCSGYVSSSFIGGATMSTRYLQDGDTMREAQETDLTSCNMAIIKTVLNEVGGFPEKLWPNEENVLFHKVKKAGYKMIYTPNAIVWHHRRPILKPFITQTFCYGQGRGKMIKMYPDSMKKIHLIPSLFVAFILIGGFVSFFVGGLPRLLFAGILLTYFVIILLESVRIAVKNGDPLVFLLLPASFFLHHCAYGLGLLSSLLKRGAKNKEQIDR